MITVLKLALVPSHKWLFEAKIVTLLSFCDEMSMVIFYIFIILFVILIATQKNTFQDDSTQYCYRYTLHLQISYT